MTDAMEVHDSPLLRKVMDEIRAELIRRGDHEALHRGLVLLDRAKHPDLRARLDAAVEEAARWVKETVISVRTGDWVEINGHPFRIGRVVARKAMVYTERLDADGAIISSVPVWANDLVALPEERADALRRAELASEAAPSLRGSARGNLTRHELMLGDRSY